jgi:hypothetical protein
MSNPTMRGQQMWYVLHWRPNGGSVILPRPDNEESNRRKRDRRKEKKQKRQERDRNKKEEDGFTGGADAATTVATK